MTDLAALDNILATYRKYGWILRRILVKDSSEAVAVASLPGVGNAEVYISDLAAAWFSRPAKNGPVAWEVRYLGDPPFALLESLDEHSPDFEASLRTIEDRLRDAISSKRPA